MTTKQFLYLGWKVNRRIERLKEERARLVAKLEGGRGSSLTGMPRGGRYDWTDGVARVMRYTERIGRDIDYWTQVQFDVREAVNRVPDLRCRDVLTCRYVLYMRWEDIADEMDYELRWIYELHRRGLGMVTVPEAYRKGQ